jgi:hypothetical protein
MRITNSKHVPWFIFVVLATAAAGWLYVGNFYPDRLSPNLQMPDALRQTPSDHRSVGGTPLGLWFGSISLGIFVFAALLSLRKKIPLWRIGTVQRWLRAHIWLTLLTIPLVILHSGFRLGGPMTTLLVVLYVIVMVSGIYGLILQHHLPRLMKERLPAETVFEQIPHIRAQLCTAAEKMRDSFKPAPTKKADAGAPAASATKGVTATSAAMASTTIASATPAARAKTTVGSDVTAAPVVAAATNVSAAPAAKAAAVPAADQPRPPTAATAPASNAAATSPAKAVETISTPTARVQSEPPGSPVARAAVPAGDEAAPAPPVAPAAPKPPATATAPAAPKPAPPAPKPAPPKPAAPAKPPPPVADPASEAVLVEFIERQILPYLRARRGERFRLGNARFADDTFRYVKLRVSEAYRTRVEEIQGWCDERRMLDLQTRLQHWLHGWLFVHVPVSFLLLMLTVWHAFVTLFYY